MTDGYVPSDFADEVSPPPRDTPEDWLRQDERGFFLSHDYYGDWRRIDIADGETIAFLRLETFGSATLTIRDDGSFTADPPMPVAAEQCCSGGEPYTLAGDVGECASYIDEAGEYEIDYFTWSDEKFRFNAAAKRFERIEVTEARRG